MTTIGGIVVATGGSPGTGRRTLLEVVDEMSRPIDASDSTVRAIAGDAFRSSVRSMNRMGLWPWEILEEDVIMSNGEKFSTVSGSVKKPLAMHYLTASGGTRDRRIPYMPYDRFVEKYSMDFTSKPYVYTVPNLFETGQIRWYPTPSSDDNLRFTYYRATPAPRNETEVLEIPETAIETYMSFAWYEFLKRLPSEQRPFPISIARAEQKDAFRELCAHVNSPGDRSRMGSYSGTGVY